MTMRARFAEADDPLRSEPSLTERVGNRVKGGLAEMIGFRRVKNLD
jgi:hypothetical protein